MKKRIVRIGVLLLASVLLAFLLEFIQIRTQPPAYESEPRVVQEADLLDLSSAELTNASFDGEVVKTGGEGTVILFRFQPAKTISYLNVESKKHIHSSHPNFAISLYGNCFAISASASIAFSVSALMIFSL